MSGTVRSLSYRPDIDGLRAIAVVMVIAFHAGVPGFSGGFTGVDVFFVISGFLITGLLVGELREKGSIDLARFYARRVRRLLPALALVMAVTLLLGWQLLLSVTGEQQKLAQSALAASLSASNFYFWKSIDYFSGHSDLMPLLHTWSLSVEEQYYFVWPALLIGLMLLARRRWNRFVRVLLIALLITGAAAFALNLWLTHTAHAAAYYLMPPRAWEFALGGMLLLAAPKIAQWPQVVRTLLFIVGMAMLVISTTAIDSSVLFPGTAVLLPALGSAAIIAAGCGVGGPLTSALASRGMVFIGLLSYSWYLWHWPLLSIARAHELGQRDLVRDVVIAILSLAVAWLTYRFVEHPIRTQQLRLFIGTRKTLMSGVGLSLAVVACAVALGLSARHSKAHSSDAWNQAVVRAVRDFPPLTGVCFQRETTQFTVLPDDPKCLTQPGRPVRLVLWGDSHANHLFPLMQTVSAELDTNVRQFAKAACPPLLGVMPFHHGGVDRECGKFNQAVAAEVARLSREGLQGVVLAGSWADYLGKPRPDGSEPSQLSYDEQPLDTAGSVHALSTGLAALIAQLEREGLKTIVVGQLPEFPYPVPECLLRRTIESCARTRTDEENRRKPVMDVLSAVVAQNTRSVHLVDPVNFFCGRRWCYPMRDKVVLFFDTNHMTASGSRGLEPRMHEDLIWLAGSAGNAPSSIGEASKNTVSGTLF